MRPYLRQSRVRSSDIRVFAPAKLSDWTTRCHGARVTPPPHRPPILNAYDPRMGETGLTIDSKASRLALVLVFFFYNFSFSRTPGNLLISSLATLKLAYYRGPPCVWVLQTAVAAARFDIIRLRHSIARQSFRISRSWKIQNYYRFENLPNR